MEHLEEAWEEAPENEVLQDYYRLKENSQYYEARRFIDTLLFHTYLFYPDTMLKLQTSTATLMEEKADILNLPAFLNENRDILLHTSYTRLLSLRAKEWAAAVVGKQHPLYAALLEISPRVQGFFLYKGQNETHISLEHIASSRMFQLTKQSFDHADSLNKIDTLIFISMVQWQGEWWFSGVHFIQEYNANKVAAEKDSLPSRQSVAFLNGLEEKEKEVLEDQRKKFMDFTGGRPLVFVHTSQMEAFNQQFIDYYNESLQLTEEQYAAARNRAKGKIPETVAPITENFF